MDPAAVAEDGFGYVVTSPGVVREVRRDSKNPLLFVLRIEPAVRYSQLSGLFVIDAAGGQ